MRDLTHLRSHFQLALERRGYDIKYESASQIDAHDPERGIKLVGARHEMDDWYTITWKLRTVGSGYANGPTQCIHITDQIDVFMDLLDTPVATRTDLFGLTLQTPLGFTELDYGLNKDGAVIRFGQIRICRATNVVVISSRGTVTEDGLEKPDAKPWFLLCCQNFQHAGFRLISDGDNFYFVNGPFGNSRAEGTVSRRAERKSIAPDQFSPSDRQTIKLAIKYYTKCLTEGLDA